MAFSDRAVAACVRSMAAGTMSERQVRDVLKCRSVDVQPIARFLKSAYPMVRRMAARIVGEKDGAISAVLDAALREEEKDVLIEMLAVVGRRGEGAQALEMLLNHEDFVIKEETISMFRRAGQANSLFPLLFDQDDATVQRIKRYINEQERKNPEKSDS